jgi:hypothetical protein
VGGPEPALPGGGRVCIRPAGKKGYTGSAFRRSCVGTGPVEGAIKNLMYRRMDHGGMRWIKERAEAVLQLRCIDANGDWTAFTDKVHADARLRSSTGAERVRLQQRTAAELPQMNKAA